MLSTRTDPLDGVNYWYLGSINKPWSWIRTSFSSPGAPACAASRIWPLCGITVSIPSRPVDNFLERNESGGHLPRSGSGWCGGVREALQELLDGSRTLFNRGALAVREWDLDQHALQVALRLQQLRLTRAFGNVAVAARARHAVWALYENAGRGSKRGSRRPHSSWRPAAVAARAELPARRR